MNIGKFISIVHRKRQQYIKEKIKELNLDIGISDYPIILIVNSKGKAGASEIAKNYALTKAQVSQSARKLGKLGYITQERDDSNRAKVTIEITPLGREVAKKMGKILKDWQSEAIRGYKPEEVENFYKLLKGITSNNNKEDIDFLV